MDESLRRQYLEAMGVESWVPRQSGGNPSAADEPPAADRPAVVMPLEPAADAGPPPWLEEVPLPAEEWVSTEMPEAEVEVVDEIACLDWPTLVHRVSQCTACELHAGRQNTVFGVGDQSANLMVIGEAPGAEEDRQGEPFVGRAGQLLNAMLLAVGLQRDQVFIANILKCRPPDNRDPRPEEALKCESFLRRQVALVQPRVILAVGRVAAQNLLKSQEAVGKMRGKAFQFEGIPVVVSYHPAYLLRSPDQKARAWQDLQRLASMLKA